MEGTEGAEPRAGPSLPAVETLAEGPGSLGGGAKYEQAEKEIYFFLLYRS